VSIDDGQAVHYTAVGRGTPVYAADEVRVGTVEEVLDNYREHILDGFVIRAEDGKLRFVDGPEVGRTAERAVTLTITSAQAAELGPPPAGRTTLSPGQRAGRLGRIFGGRRAR
jgi:hypothetical protein